MHIVLYLDMADVRLNVAKRWLYGLSGIIIADNAQM